MAGRQSLSSRSARGPLNFYRKFNYAYAKAGVETPAFTLAANLLRADSLFVVLAVMLVCN